MPNTKRVTLADVAQHAGVGVATVDRVLNARARVSQDTAARVMAAAEALGYHGRVLMRQRLQDLVPLKRLGFVLQKQSKWFYQELAQAIHLAARAQVAIRAKAEITFVESLAPGELSHEIARMTERNDAVAVVSIDHPEVSAAINAAENRRGPVFALLSPLTAPGVAGYVGIDSQRAGRTAGWAMARLSHGVGDVGILVGSYRYLGHEALEAGFRSAMREYAPERRLRESIVYLDDSAVAYEAASELLSSRPDLGGLYHVGGGVRGVIKALEESGRAKDVTYICHENSPATQQALTKGLVDLVIATPIYEVADLVVRSMTQSVLGESIDPSAIHPPEFRLITSENV
ncbi:LacI family DNA-binding transcriptional regulator [Aliiroseovarius crassostreae]|uniref:LacI family DNA-binding transcriptional regulator n=1 Tax=Aliiroseovarius crassostreae TaxID=154981 RepID=UPI003C7CEC49